MGQFDNGNCGYYRCQLGPVTNDKQDKVSHDVVFTIDLDGNRCPKYYQNSGKITPSLCTLGDLVNKYVKYYACKD